VYEALEAGCIPVVESRLAFDYCTGLFGAHPLPSLFCNNRVEELESLRLSCESWWSSFKRRLHLSTKATVLGALK